jgi:hypothetical protein
MKRRIERSRARCDKPATNNKTLKGQAADKQPKLNAPLQNTEKGG